MAELTLRELRSMSIEDLQKEIRDVQLEVQKMRLSLQLGKSKASHAYRERKRLLARALTVMREKARL